MHLKALAAPKWRGMLRKAKTWILRPLPGPHSKAALPLGLIIKNLGLAANTREVKKILNLNNIQVDSKRRRKINFPLGFMDSLIIGESAYRVVLDKKGFLDLKKISLENANKKLVKVVNRKKLRGNYQIFFHDGTSILTKEPYAINSTLLISLPEKKVLEEIKLSEGAEAMVIDGSKKGAVGKIKKILNKFVLFSNEVEGEVPIKNVFLLKEGFE